MKMLFAHHLILPVELILIDFKNTNISLKRDNSIQYSKKY